jgi:IclR family mhp operon transcriptional activator
MPTKKMSMDSVRPIRALMRGLDSLQQLNRHNGATVTDIAKAVKLPRTTAYRVLETLCVAGYAIRDPSDDRYRLTTKVRSLSDGYNDESWVQEIAKPLLSKLAQDVVWPLAISTLSGTSMLVRETTDRDSPLALERYSAGLRVPVLGSSSGRVYLAHCSDEQRNVLLDVLERSDRPEDKIARDRELVSRILGEVKRNGYAVFDNPSMAETSMAVPLFVKSNVIGGVVIRFIRSAMNPDQAVDKHLHFMQRTAEEIGKAFDQVHTPGS